MNEQAKLRSGIIGAAVAGVCCFTPVLVVILGFAGLSAVVGWLDYGLFPVMFASMGLVAHTLYARADRVGPPPAVMIIAIVVALTAFLFWFEFRYALRVSFAAAAAVAVYAWYLRARSVAATKKPGS